MRWYGWLRAPRWARQVRYLVAVEAAVLLVAGLLAYAVPHLALNGSPSPAGSAAVKNVTVVQPKKVKADNQAAPEYQAGKAAWPAAATGTALLAAPTAGEASGPAAKINGTPLWVQAVSGGGKSGAAHADAYQGPSQVTATVLPHATATELGLSAVAFTVAGSGSAGSVRVGLNYSSFAQAYGANYGSRLKLVELPACAMTTPQVAACRKQTPLDSAQDYKSSAVSSVLTLGARTEATLDSYTPGAVLDAANGTVVGATDSTGQEGGQGGSYAAAALKPSGTWTEGGDSGAFTYSYPVTVPSASSQLTPSVSLNYDSQEVDGQTATTQAQSSWAGDGWQTPDSYIALSTVPCDDDPEGSASPSATTDECYDGQVLQMSLNGTDTTLVFSSSSTSGGVTTSKWRAQADEGAVITHVSASSSVFGAYSLGGDYWTVTERDGTTYSFGLQHLPGWASGDAATASVETLPVYSAHSGDPCYSSSGFSSSVCTMAYKWHLDYVTDAHGEAMSYYYGQTTNYYGEDAGASDVSYVSDSYLKEIDYGFLAGGAYGTVPDKVAFATASRCVASTCGALSTSNSSVATQYPDVPADLICASGTTCTAYAPSLFSEVRLASITTEQYSVSASAYQDIDAYTLTQTEPASGDGLSPTLWLNSVQHAGDDTSAGGSSSAITLPSVTFGKVDMQNRVFTATYPGLYRYRIASITTEMGAVTNVSYGTPDACSSSYSSSSGTSVTSVNTDSCFPVFWTPEGSPSPVLDWFESYAVTQVVSQDPTGGSPQQETDYSYGGGAAWHYDDNQVVQPKYRTWGQLRGYATVTTKTGDGADPQTEIQSAYYRGMNGDTLPSGTSSVTLTDSQGGTHTDYAPLAGDALETTTYLGAGGPVESSTITSYWVSGATATMNPSGLPALTANMTEPAETWTRTAVTDGGETGDWTVTETDDSYDAGTSDADFGLLEYSYSHTDPVNAAYDSCTADQYASVNTAENLVGLVSRTETDKVACSGYATASPASAPAALNALGAPSSVSRPSQVAKATETFYDDTTFSTTFPQTAAPTTGNVTMTRQASGYSGGAFTWQTEARDTYDAYGRTVNAYDADGNETVTSYTVNTAGLTTATQTAAPPTTYVNSSGTTVTTTHVSSQTLDPTRALTLTSTDQDGVVTAEQYDALGRPTSVWKDSRPTSDTANVTYAYTVSDSSISGVVTQTLNEEANYVPSVTIYDALGRTRQTQTLGTTASGDGRLVTDTLYDTRGWVSQVNTNYYDDSAEPSLSLVSVPSNEVADQDDYVYDGAGRKVEDVNKDDGTVRSTSVTAYNGDSTTVIPNIPGTAASGAVPSGAGVVQTTQVNPLGQTTSLVQYTADPTLTIPVNPATGAFSIAGGTAAPTAYAYDAQGNQDSESTGGQTWTQQYNLLGQETSSTDPDAGTTAMSYDGDGNLLQSLDAAGNYLSYTYDADGRKTAQYAAPTSGQQAYVSSSSPGNETASWVYDNANAVVSGMADADGQETTSYSYAGGYAYDVQQIGFNVFGESMGQAVYVPSSAPGSAISTGLAYQDTYGTVNGTLVKQSFPAAGGLPAETVSYSTTGALDLPSGVGGYAQETSYTAWSQPEQVTLGSGSDEAFVTDSYDPDTGSLTGQLVTRSTGTATVDDTTWGYNAAGQVTSQTDERSGTTADSETQCFAYTGRGQLAQAWTATDACAAVPTASSHATVGDALGTASEYDESWTYNAAGQRASASALVPSSGAYATTTYGYSSTSPGEMTSAATTGAATATSTYGYNADGQQDSRATPAGSQNLTWDAAGQLTAVTAASGGATVASYVYGADGDLFSATEGASTTLYLPGEQLTDNNGALSGTRYYSLPGGITAVRTGSGSAYGFEIASDQHGTNTLYLDSTAQVPTWRQYDPFGNARGAAAASGTFPGPDAFLGAPADTVTGLDQVGARWYDPVTGSFASLDPVLETASPLDLNGYAYSGQDPVNSSDPSGEMACTTEGACGSAAFLESLPATQGGLRDGCLDYMPGCPGFTGGGAGPAGEPVGGSPAPAGGHVAAAVRQSPAQVLSAFAPGCSGTLLKLGACPSEAGAAGTTAAQVKNAWEGAAWVLSGAVPVGDVLDGIAGLFGAADDGTGTLGDLLQGATCGGESFTPATPVLTASGAAVPIASLKPGDKVEARDTKTGKNQPEAVTAVLVHHDADLYDLTVKTSHGTQVIHTTSNHLFWSAGKWVEAASLKNGDPLQTPDGTPAVADGGTVPKDRAGWMWDLTVPGNNDHDFYVLTTAPDPATSTAYAETGSTPILVHNCGDGGSTWTPDENYSPDAIKARSAQWQNVVDDINGRAAQKAVGRKQGPRQIGRVDAPEESVPGSQWHAQGPGRGSPGINMDGTYHDGNPNWPNQVIQWLIDYGWRIGEGDE